MEIEYVIYYCKSVMCYSLNVMCYSFYVKKLHKCLHS
nr:MAG TPA: hypothetical protein [Crassvirales sp.]